MGKFFWLKISQNFFFIIKAIKIFSIKFKPHQVVEGNSNHHERFHTKIANISTRYNDWKFVAVFG